MMDGLVFWYEEKGERGKKTWMMVLDQMDDRCSDDTMYDVRIDKSKERQESKRILVNNLEHLRSSRI